MLTKNHVRTVRDASLSNERNYSPPLLPRDLRAQMAIHRGIGVIYIVPNRSHKLTPMGMDADIHTGISLSGPRVRLTAMQVWRCMSNLQILSSITPNAHTIIANALVQAKLALIVIIVRNCVVVMLPLPQTGRRQQRTQWRKIMLVNQKIVSMINALALSVHCS